MNPTLTNFGKVLTKQMHSFFLTSYDKKKETIVTGRCPPILENRYCYGLGRYPDYIWQMDFRDSTIHGKYQGEVENGVPNGFGFLITPQREKYVGEFKDGKLNGKGEYTGGYNYGYVGEFKDGKFNGQGTHIYTLGYVYVGSWKNGKRWNGTYYNKDLNIKYKWVNGREIRH